MYELSSSSFHEHCLCFIKLTSFVIQLLQYFCNNLSNRLNSFEIIFRLVVSFLLSTDIQPD